MTNARYRKLTARLIGAWFLFSLFASAMHMFYNAPDRPPLPIGLAVVIPVSIVAIWAAISQSFRQFLLSLNPRSLTIIHSLRIAGYTFLVLYTYAILPGVFALSAGWGDIAIGATAFLVATKLTRFSHRKGFVLWQILGITDLTMAVTLGATAHWISPQAVAATPLTVLPLSLIPTFAVPLFLILHGICIAQARRWTANFGVEEHATVSLIRERQAL